MQFFSRMILTVVICYSLSQAIQLDSLFEPIMKPFDFLPDYYTRFGLSTFTLHKDAFFKRQYLAEPHPELEFCFLSYKNTIASVWQSDFQFGLGNVPGNNVFTVLNVAFGISPEIELRFADHKITGGIAHRCFHEIDRSDFPLVWYNKLFLSFSPKNSRLNDYFHILLADSSFSFKNRLSWETTAGYYLQEFFGLADPNKLSGNNPLIWEIAGTARYAFHKRTSWIFTIRSEAAAGNFSQQGGYHVLNGSNWYYKTGFGMEAFFIRGARGMSVYGMYYRDDLPIEQSPPSFALGNSRFSKNGLLQIGLIFFN